MKKELLLDCVKETDVFHHFRDLFKTLSGLEVHLYDAAGQLIPLPAHKREAVPQPPVAFSTPFPSVSSSREIHPRFDIDPLSDFLNTREPRIFVGQEGLKHILVPIIHTEEPIGFLAVKEQPEARLDAQKLKSLPKILSNFIAYVLRSEMSVLDHFKGSQVTHQQGILNKVTKYIKENYHSNELSLKEVSQNSGVSYYYLSHLFKKELKTTFAQYRNKVRMDVACKLLLDNRLSIGEVSFACGFDDPGYFCKVFKETFGNSPLGYRSQKGSPRRKGEFN